MFCHAWNKLISHPWKIMSIGLKRGSHEFLLLQIGITHSCLDIYRQLSPVRLGDADKRMKSIDDYLFNKTDRYFT